jgi:hypothetical protein
MRGRITFWMLVGGLVLQPSDALAQEETPTPAPTPELPLIQDVSLFVLLLVVVILGVFLLALIALRISGTQTKNHVQYRPLIEGMVLVMVVVCLTILGVAGKITAEGLASVLAAIVGYAVGRNVGERNGKDQNDRAQGDGGEPPTDDVDSSELQTTDDSTLPSASAAERLSPSAESETAVEQTEEPGGV